VPVSNEFGDATRRVGRHLPADVTDVARWGHVVKLAKDVVSLELARALGRDGVASGALEQDVRARAETPVVAKFEAAFAVDEDPYVTAARVRQEAPNAGAASPHIAVSHTGVRGQPIGLVPQAASVVYRARITLAPFTSIDLSTGAAPGTWTVTAFVGPTVTLYLDSVELGVGTGATAADRVASLEADLLSRPGTSSLVRIARTAAGDGLVVESLIPRAGSLTAVGATVTVSRGYVGGTGLVLALRTQSGVSAIPFDAWRFAANAAAVTPAEIADWVTAIWRYGHAVVEDNGALTFLSGDGVLLEVDASTSPLVATALGLGTRVTGSVGAAASYLDGIGRWRIDATGLGAVAAWAGTRYLTIGIGAGALSGRWPIVQVPGPDAVVIDLALDSGSSAPAASPTSLVGVELWSGLRDDVRTRTAMIRHAISASVDLSIAVLTSSVPQRDELAAAVFTWLAHTIPDRHLGQFAGRGVFAPLTYPLEIWLLQVGAPTMRTDSEEVDPKTNIEAARIDVPITVFMAIDRTATIWTAEDDPALPPRV
jgi:hypothetical protein